MSSPYRVVARPCRAVIHGARVGSSSSLHHGWTAYRSQPHGTPTEGSAAQPLYELHDTRDSMRRCFLPLALLAYAGAGGGAGVRQPSGADPHLQQRRVSGQSDLLGRPTGRGVAKRLREPVSTRPFAPTRVSSPPGRPERSKGVCRSGSCSTPRSIRMVPGSAIRPAPTSASPRSPPHARGAYDRACAGARCARDLDARG